MSDITAPDVTTPDSAAPDAAAALRDRIAALRAGPAFRNYELVKDRVLAMRTHAARRADVRPSEYWAQDLANLEYMLDASPLLVDTLRHESYHLTGLYLYNYRLHQDRQKDKFAAKLRELKRIGRPELLVPEARMLGGFGFEIDGELYNLDTLKFFEVLIALDKGTVLPEFLGNADRRLVWEIGAGWGGFPYQFKTLCPNVTYVITDFPEVFLFSATYLMTAFPDARVGFWGEMPTARFWESWQDYDFLFMPNTALEEMTPPRLDLTLNMVSFQEMTHDQVTAYVERAHRLESPFLYSLNREASSYNPEIESVSSIIDRFYWPKGIEILHVPYTRMLDSAAGTKDYRHVLGWRRVKT